MISLVRVGGSRELEVGGAEVGGQGFPSFDIWDIEIVVEGIFIEGREDCSEPIMGERLGGPTELFKDGAADIWGRGEPGIIWGEPGEPGIGEFTPPILGIIFMFPPLGAGGRPIPVCPDLGDIFCLGLGLGWPVGFPLNPSRALDWETFGRRGAIALDIAVLPGGAPVAIGGRTGGPPTCIPPIGLFWLAWRLGWCWTWTWTWGWGWGWGWDGENITCCWSPGPGLRNISWPFDCRIGWWPACM